MATKEQVVETPAQMLARLDRMGEERVRYLLSSAYFDPQQEPLVKGWLDEKERDRGVGPAAEQDRAETAMDELRTRVRKAEGLALRSSEAAARSAEAIKTAVQAQQKSAQVTWIALILGSLAMLTSIVALLL